MILQGVFILFELVGFLLPSVVAHATHNIWFAHGILLTYFIIHRLHIQLHYKQWKRAMIEKNEQVSQPV
jgi:hypothetical protein